MIQLETQILHCNPYDLSSCHCNIYTGCIEIGDNISIVGGGLETVEHRATGSKVWGRFLEVEDQQYTRPWAYSEWKASKGIVHVWRGRGCRNINSLCGLVIALRLLTYKAKSLTANCSQSSQWWSMRFVADRQETSHSD